MAIDIKEIEKASQEEKEQIAEALGLKTQKDVDTSHYVGKQAGIKEAQKNVADLEKQLAEVKTEASKTQVESKIESLGLKLSEEDKEKLIKLADGNADNIDTLAHFINGGKGTDNPFSGDKKPDASTPEKNKSKDLGEKDENGNYKDEDLREMASSS